MSARRHLPNDGMPAPAGRALAGELDRLGRLKLERLGVFARPAPLLPPGQDIAPTAERASHDPVERLADQIADSRGLIGLPYVALSTLVVMERHGTITSRQRRVGEAFHDQFRRAMLDDLKAAALDRIPAAGGALSEPHGNGNERARRAIGGAIRALGGEAALPASCAWHVLGLEWSLREWSLKALRGNADMARGVLVVTLGFLEPHFAA